MKENNIEEDIKNAQHFIKSIKTDKEYKEENGWHGYYNKEIVELARMLEHILLDYKKISEENEDLENDNKYLREREAYLEKRREDTINLFQNQQTATTIPIQKAKDRIEKYKNMCISNVKGYENYFKDDYNEFVFRRLEQLEKELLESEE